MFNYIFGRVNHFQTNSILFCTKSPASFVKIWKYPVELLSSSKIPKGELGSYKPKSYQSTIRELIRFTSTGRFDSDIWMQSEFSHSFEKYVLNAFYVSTSTYLTCYVSYSSTICQRYNFDLLTSGIDLLLSRVCIWVYFGARMRFLCVGERAYVEIILLWTLTICRLRITDVQCDQI